MTTKENIIATLRFYKPELSKLGVQSIGLFGSYLRNEQSDKSDIDLKDETLKRALTRSLEIIGEATKQIPADFKVKWNSISFARANQGSTWGNRKL